MFSMNRLTTRVAKKGVDVVYLRGNHDYEMTLGDLKVAMGGEKFQYVDRIVEGGIRYEHGHEVDIFNIDPPKLGNEKTTMRPLGYYVARSAETSELKRNREAGRSIQLCREMDPTFFAPALVTVLSVNEVFQVVIETLLREALTANPQTWYNKVIKGGDIYRNGKDVTLGDAIKNYYNLIERFRKERSMEYISGMISAGCGENSYWAQQTKEKVLVYGHTHVS
jgi:UDP-2,3-diacylglucosamine pyrophosphatase LpxH